MWLLWKKLLVYILVLGTASYFGYELLPVTWSGDSDGREETWNNQVAVALGSPKPVATPHERVAASPDVSAPSVASIGPDPTSPPTSSAERVPSLSSASPSDGPLAVKKIAINRANWQELTELPGIGETKAKAIVEYRGRHGGFRTIDELTEVKGIGTKTVERLRTYVTL